jgi:hypothetical protein
LPASLTNLCYHGNNSLTLLSFPPMHTVLHATYSTDSIYDLRIKNNTLNRFRFTFYLLKCKQRLRSFLWAKVREPKIQRQFHPRYLSEELSEETDLDEFMNNWVKTDEYLH